MPGLKQSLVTLPKTTKTTKKFLKP
ncbi:hypothetical protein TSAR_010588 [Trichomalopsis sarcophagae]|uniref:Uncharacterized protein n=1 Tax=Trichomalopsis sarcophagae TaxID=543379 RepID=A0A232EN64_9HYME|nr:hypothetical protein TSAR_010588 [Trichomalopsis sarcophagae]